MRLIRRAVLLTIAAAAAGLLMATLSGPMVATVVGPPLPLPTPILGGGSDWCGLEACGT